MTATIMSVRTWTKSAGLFRCDCVIGFTGPRCEQNINECASNPCHNEATCLDEKGAYTCVCMDGYEGRD